ncbi:MAG TPA: T9SS type A sorting domain-containing protein, partial [Ignavibacteriaceae bacterium]|nr:T9SS type A sorting domain-containing protein [Ignavibacteriaceae bacterium]
NSLDNSVELQWRTSTETNSKGFEVQRKINSNWEKIGFINGHGTTTSLTEYQFTDEFKGQTYNGELSYRLKQIDFDGTFEYSKEILLNVNFGPKEYFLYQNYPNPFNPSTTIRYAVPLESKVEITIFDMLGEIIELFHEGIKEKGMHEIQWEPKNLSSGVYFYSVNAKSTDGKQSYLKTQKMLLMK